MNVLKFQSFLSLFLFLYFMEEVRLRIISLAIWHLMIIIDVPIYVILPWWSMRDLSAWFGKEKKNNRCTNICYSTLMKYERFKRVIRNRKKKTIKQNKTKAKTKIKRQKKKNKRKQNLTLRGLCLLHSVWNLWLSTMLCYKLLISSLFYTVTALFGCFPSDLSGGTNINRKDALTGFYQWWSRDTCFPWINWPIIWRAGQQGSQFMEFNHDKLLGRI